MKKIILTGFEPFGPYIHNPTQQSTLDFHGKIFGDREVVGIVLPSVYNAWGWLASTILHNSDAYAIISTGLASSAKGIRIESTFRNTMNGKYSDANGYAPNNIPVLNKNVPYTIHSKAPHKKLFHLLLENDIPTERSNDAGNFICNALGYTTSVAMRNARYVNRNLFVHIPWTTPYKDKVSIEPGKIFLDHELYYKGLELLITNI
jgi:pyroglutamyl-peptidase